MSIKRSEIEAMVENTIEDLIAEVFNNHSFNNESDLEFALEYLKSKIDELDVADFEDSIT
jgi:hypothetical protein